MSIPGDHVAEVLALPAEDRTFVVRQLIGNLGQEADSGAEDLWDNEMDRRSREMEDSLVLCRPVADSVSDIRAKLDARRQSS